MMPMQKKKLMSQEQMAQMLDLEPDQADVVGAKRPRAPTAATTPTLISMTRAIRAVRDGSVRALLEAAFGGDETQIRRAMQALATICKKALGTGRDGYVDSLVKIESGEINDVVMSIKSAAQQQSLRNRLAEALYNFAAGPTEDADEKDTARTTAERRPRAER